MLTYVLLVSDATYVMLVSDAVGSPRGITHDPVALKRKKVITGLVVGVVFGN